MNKIKSINIGKKFNAIIIFPKRRLGYDKCNGVRCAGRLHGSYGALRSGSVARALQELSGGVVQSFAPPRQPRALLLQVLHSAVPRSTLLVASAAPAAPVSARALAGLYSNNIIWIVGVVA